MELSIWIKPSFVGRTRFTIKEIRSTRYSCLVLTTTKEEGDGLEQHGFTYEGEKYNGHQWVSKEPVEHTCNA